MLDDYGRSPGRLWRFMRLVTLAVAVITVGVTIFFSIRSEQRESLSIHYLAKRQLISPEARRAGVGLEIEYEGERVERPWILAGRLENSGNQPIEERDIEQFPTLGFRQARILNAEVTGGSQPGIVATAEVRQQAIIIKHKLLNPGDWVSFDVLFDGEPEMPPDASLRISGVRRPKQVLPSEQEKVFYVTWPPLPLPLTYGALLIATLGGLLVVVVGAVGFSSALDSPPPSHGPSRGAYEREYLLSMLRPESIARQVALDSAKSIALLSLAGVSIDLQWVDKPEDLVVALQDRVDPKVFEALELSAESAASEIVAELRLKVQELASRIGRRGWAQDQVAHLDLNDLPVNDFLARVAAIRVSSIDTSPSNSVESRFEWDEIVFATVAILIGIAMILLAGGGWRILLGK